MTVMYIQHYKNGCSNRNPLCLPERFSITVVSFECISCQVAIFKLCCSHHTTGESQKYHWRKKEDVWKKILKSKHSKHILYLCCRWTAFAACLFSACVSFVNVSYLIPRKMTRTHFWLMTKRFMLKNCHCDSQKLQEF